jgi:hypothetical protein
MAITNVQTNFTSGELDPELRARLDIKTYYNGAEKMRNVLVIPQGGARRRPGLGYRDQLNYTLSNAAIASGQITAVNGGTVGNLIDGDLSTYLDTTTNISTTDPYVVFSVDFGAATTDPRYFDVRSFGLLSNGGAAVESINSFYVQHSADGSTWSNAGSAFRSVGTDTLKDYRRELPSGTRYARVARIGSDDLGVSLARCASVEAWDMTSTISEVRLISFQFSIVQRYLLVATDRNIAVYKNGVWQRDIPTAITGEMLPEINWTQNLDTLLLFTGTYQPLAVQRQGADDEWQPFAWVLNNIPQFDYGEGGEDVWSDARGWPVSGTFFQGRLMMAGSIGRPQTVWGSRSGDPNDFDTSLTDVDYGIDVTAETDDVCAFCNIYAGRHLQLFSESSEFYVPISDENAVTPKNFVLRRTSSRGSKKGVKVVEVDGATMFLQRGGKALRELLFSITDTAYSAQNLSLLASHLVQSPVDMALRRSTSTDDADYVLLVNGDGTLAMFCTLRLQDINAWTLCETDGEFKSVGVDDQDMYFAVKRTINGVEKLYLEVFDDDLYVDCATNGSGVASNASVPQLVGETVRTVLDNLQQPDIVASNATVDFPRASMETYQVGLRFPDVTDSGDGVYRETWVKTMPVEPNLSSGSIFGTKKRIVQVHLRLRDTSSLYVNRNLVAFRQLGATLLDQPIPSFTGDTSVRGVLGWDDFGQVNVYQQDSLNMKILGIAAEISVRGG